MGRNREPPDSHQPKNCQGPTLTRSAQERSEKVMRLLNGGRCHVAVSTEFYMQSTLITHTMESL